MTTPDLETAKEMYSLYLNAEKAIVSGAQAYSIGNRQLTRANLTEIVEMRKEWGNLVERLFQGNGGARVISVIPRDR